jgi:two-component system OmpR family response regulator
MPDMKHDHISNEGESSGAPAEVRPKPPRRILLVDDEREVLNLNADVLVRAGYLVDTAEDGASGWKALKANRYDVLITDNSMPGVTGLELIKKARSEDMTLSVILASGTVPAEELNRCPWLEVSALLPKPYSIAALLRTVDQVLRTADGNR